MTLMPAPSIAIAALDPTSFAEATGRLAEILQACVREGASVGFVLPFEIREASAYWRDKVAPAHAAGSRIVLIASLDGDIAGTAQLDLDSMPSKRHHAEVSKVLFDPRLRRAGGPLAAQPRYRGRRRRGALPLARL